MAYNGPTNPLHGLPNSNKHSPGGLIKPKEPISTMYFMWGKDGFSDPSKTLLLANHIITEHLLPPHYMT